MPKKIIKGALVFILLSIAAFFSLNYDKLDFLKIRNVIHAEEEDWEETCDSPWEINGNETLEKGLTVRNKSININEGGTLTIEPGAKIELVDDCMGESTQISVLGGRIIANGTQEDPIYISRPWENHHGSLIYFRNDIYNDGRVSTPESSFSYVKISGGGLSPSGGGGGCEPFCPAFQNIFRSFTNTAYADDYGQPALDFYGGKMRMENCQFSDNSGMDVRVEIDIRTENQDDSLKIIDSNFERNINNIAAVANIYGDKLTENPNVSDMFALENNWYGDPNGPKRSSEAEIGGEEIIGAYSLHGYSNERWKLFPNNSNVMFLPGIKASKLYKEGEMSEDQLWPPNYFGDDISDLMLNQEGESDENIYTREIIEEVGLPIVGGNIYKTFIENLEDLKESLDINDYSLFAYDWRKNAEDIIANGTPYPEGEIKYAVDEILNLAANSQNKKVTIIAHSNGGLLAKAIIKQLDEWGMVDAVDKIILVGTPQMGTPRAILSLLYGYDEELAFGSLMSRAEARKLGENMPGAYGLLPSEKYFNLLDENEPLLDFSAIDPLRDTRYKIFKDVYGENIGKGEYDEFFNFLTGSGDGRQEPDDNETELENTLRLNLLEEAIDTHENLDAWAVPENIQLIQIAGWGLDTISGVKYAEKQKVECSLAGSSLPVCAKTNEYEPIYEPMWTVDGDEVVTSPSALMLPEAGSNIEKYWVDLWSYDDILTTERKHSDILEVSDLQQFLDDIIMNKYQSGELPENIKDHRPEPEGYDDAKPRIRMSLYSPLNVHLYDEENNHTGPTDENGNFEEKIPNSYYQQFGERKYVGFSEGEKIRIELDGYASGSYDLKMEEVALTENSEEIISRTAFVNLPVSENTIATLEVPAAGLVDLSTLEADFDGDGTNDYAVTPILNGEATILEDSADMDIFIFQENVQKYWEKGLIKTKAERNKLLVSAKLIENEIRLLEMIKANLFLKEKTKKLLITIIERGIENQLDLMIKMINKNKKNYDLAIKDILIENLRWIKNNYKN